MRSFKAEATFLKGKRRQSESTMDDLLLKGAQDFPRNADYDHPTAAESTIAVVMVLPIPCDAVQQMSSK